MPDTDPTAAAHTDAPDDTAATGTGTEADGEADTGTDTDTDTDGLTVGQVSARLGVTVRALHHWDEIGLARPSLRTGAGYRLYTAADLERLHRVVVYRELGLGLDRIRAVLDDAGTDVPAALRAQRAQVAERVERLRRLGAGLDRMIEAHERGLLLTVEQQAAIFGPDWDPEGPVKARKQYGDTPQWRQYAERAAGRTPEEWQAVHDATAALDRGLAAALDAGVAPGSREANALVDRHRAVFAAYFPLTRKMQVCLARTYASDPGFAAHYDGVRPGLAAWFRAAVDASARAHGIDPDTATWE
ncbi:MerR family transcriptional regulator [Streptomyces roseolus]|uniref:MerR family transcriptional regulator n=1 Tax=Streptomyces roseolus TaxID=67358 RepID=UPI0033DF8CE4